MRAQSWPIATRDRSRHMVPVASVRAAALTGGQAARAAGHDVASRPP